MRSDQDEGLTPPEALCRTNNNTAHSELTIDNGKLYQLVVMQFFESRHALTRMANPQESAPDISRGE